MPDVFKSVDNENFAVVGSSPAQINQLIWQGLPGKYLAITAAGLLTTIDYGATWGYLYPNTEFGTALPGGATGYQTAFAIGPNPGGNCIGAGTLLFSANEGSNPHTSLSGVTIAAEENDADWDVISLLIAQNNLAIEVIAQGHYTGTPDPATGWALGLRTINYVNSSNAGSVAIEIRVGTTYFVAVFTLSDGNGIPDWGTPTIDGMVQIFENINAGFRLTIFQQGPATITDSEQGYSATNSATNNTTLVSSITVTWPNTGVFTCAIDILI